MRPLYLALAILAGSARGAAADPDPGAVTRVGVSPWSEADGLGLGQSGRALTHDVGPARRALEAFAASADEAALGVSLAGLAGGDRLLALGALGTAMSQRYVFPAPATDHAQTLAAAATWLRGESGPDAGSCTAIHDSLRRLARAAGWRDAVTLQVASGRDRGHVITAVPTADGWAVLDYGTVVATGSTDFGDALALASAWSGRLAGDVTVSGRTRLARFETAAGRQAREFLDHAGADGLFDGFLRGPVRRAATIGARAGSGVVAVEAGGAAWTVGAGLLGLGGDGLAESPAVRAGGRLARAGQRWWIDAQGSVGTFAWRWDDEAQANTLGAAAISAGAIGRLGSASWRFGLAAEWLADLETLPAQLRDAGGDPFWWLLRAGPGASLSVPLGADLDLQVATLALAERTVVEPRAETAGVTGSWWRTEVAVGDAFWRLAVRSTWEPLGWTHAGSVGLVLAPGLRGTIEAARTWSRRPGLQGAADSAEVRLEWTGGRWSAACGLRGERGRGAHEGRATAELTCRVAWRLYY